MALATSGTINLTDVRDFYGQSGSINMTNLHKGESNIPNPTTYGSSTVGTGSISVNATGTANTGASYLTTTLPVVPHNLYQYGGVVPSLDTEANQTIEESGEVSLTDYYGGYRIVNPTAGSISGSKTGNQRYWFNGAPYAYAGFFGGNYEQITGNLGTSNVSNYTQLITVQSNPYSSHLAGTVTCTFTLSHAGIYTVYASVFGNGGSGQYFSLSGTGASLKTHAGVSVSGNITLPNYMPTAATARLFELTHTNTSATLTLVCGGTGGATYVQIRTNTNYLRDVNTTNTTKYNDMLTQS